MFENIKLMKLNRDLKKEGLSLEGLNMMYQDLTSSIINVISENLSPECQDILKENMCKGCIKESSFSLNGSLLIQTTMSFKEYVNKILAREQTSGAFNGVLEVRYIGDFMYNGTEELEKLRRELDNLGTLVYNQLKVTDMKYTGISEKEFLRSYWIPTGKLKNIKHNGENLVYGGA